MAHGRQIRISIPENNDGMSTTTVLKNETIISTVQKPYNIIMYNSEYGSFASGL